MKLVLVLQTTNVPNAKNQPLNSMKLLMFVNLVIQLRTFMSLVNIVRNAMLIAKLAVQESKKIVLIVSMKDPILMQIISASNAIKTVQYAMEQLNLIARNV